MSIDYTRCGHVKSFVTLSQRFHAGAVGARGRGVQSTLCTLRLLSSPGTDASGETGMQAEKVICTS